MDASLPHPLGVARPSGLHHTDYSDINEAMCFLGIIHHPTARKICEVGGDSWTPKEAVKTINSEIPRLEGSFLDTADIAVIKLLAEKLHKAQSVPTAHLAARIKAIQGFNMALFLIKVFGDRIKEVYFTNTRTLLIAALDKFPPMAKIIAHNTLSHPADLLLILEDARGRQPYGVSCKASFGKTTPTVCNLGLGSVNKMILGNNSGCTPITTDGVEAGMKLQHSGVRGAMISVLRNKQVELAKQLAAHFRTTPSAPRLLLTEFLHIQPNNLPYCIISAEGQDIHGIDFERLKNELATHDGNFIGGAGAPAEGVISSSIILQSGGGPQFEFKTRLKKAGSRGVSLKLNVTLSNTLKRLLMHHYILVNIGGGKRVKHGGFILRSGFNTNPGPLIITPIDVAAAAAEAEEEEFWLTDASTPEDPIDGPYPNACGGAAVGGRRKRCSSRKKRRTKHKRKKRKRRKKKYKRRRKTRRRRRKKY